MHFQPGDRIIHFGLILVVDRVTKTAVHGHHVGRDQAIIVPLALARRHQRGHWRGEPIPLHRRVPTLMEPYVWSHIV